jgi:ABC-type transporter lipoprotein component MlaA
VAYVDKRASLLSLEPTLATAYDPYVFIRDAYLQRRAYLVSGGSLKKQEEPLIDPDAPDQPVKP